MTIRASWRDSSGSSRVNWGHSVAVDKFRFIDSSARQPDEMLCELEEFLVDCPFNLLKRPHPEIGARSFVLGVRLL